MTSSRGGLEKITEDDGGGRGSENPEFEMTSFVNAPYAVSFFVNPRLKPCPN